MGMGLSGGGELVEAERPREADNSPRAAIRSSSVLSKDEFRNRESDPVSELEGEIIRVAFTGAATSSFISVSM